MILDTVDVKKKGVHTRYLILLIIFIVTAVNYADRSSAPPGVTKKLSSELFSTNTNSRAGASA